MEAMIGLIIGVVIGAVIAGAVLWVVSSLGLGLKVSGFGSAMIAGLLIGLLTGVARMIFTGGGLLGPVVNLVIAAAVIYICGKILKGLTVDGFVGALIAAFAIAVINFLIGFLFSGAA